MRNEHTSPEIASKAAAILAHADEFVPGQLFYARRKKGLAIGIALDDILSWAGSLTTQAANHAEMKAGRLPRGHKLVKRHKPITRSGKARRA